MFEKSVASFRAQMFNHHRWLFSGTEKRVAIVHLDDFGGKRGRFTLNANGNDSFSVKYKINQLSYLFPASDQAASHKYLNPLSTFYLSQKVYPHFHILAAQFLYGELPSSFRFQCLAQDRLD
jgi:hypothetical protein